MGPHPQLARRPERYAQPENLDMTTVVVVALANLFFGLCLGCLRMCRPTPRTYAPRIQLGHATPPPLPTNYPLQWVAPLMRLDEEQILAIGGYDVLVFALPGALTQDLQELRALRRYFTHSQHERVLRRRTLATKLVRALSLRDSERSAALGPFGENSHPHVIDLPLVRKGVPLVHAIAAPLLIGRPGRGVGLRGACRQYEGAGPSPPIDELYPGKVVGAVGARRTASIRSYAGRTGAAARLRG